MKIFFKLIGVIALTAVIGFSLAGCGFLIGDNDTDDTNNDSSGNGGSGTKPTITIKNNTGYTIIYSWIKPSTSLDWGFFDGLRLADGESEKVTLSQHLSTQNVYDIRLGYISSSGYYFIKYGVTISNGMTITFTTSDLNDGSNLPTITIKNRSGKTFDSLHIKPSSSSDWGTNFGSTPNNDNRSITIPIPPSNYTVFDIQMRSSNPTNTYTRSNVTVSNGMVLMFTSADADNSTIELPVIVIQNNTGYTLPNTWIKSSTSIDWGSGYNLYLADGESKAVTLSQHLSTQNVYDIRLRQNPSSGFMFTKYNVTVSDGIIVTFTASDLE